MSRRDRTPTPREPVRKRAEAKVVLPYDNLIDLLQRVKPTRLWAENTAYGRRTRDEGTTRYAKGAVSNPTESTADDESLLDLRAAIDNLDAMTVAAQRDILGAVQRIEYAMDHTDPRHVVVRDRFPEETKAEIAKAKEARKRREERGESHGAA